MDQRLINEDDELVMGLHLIADDGTLYRLADYDGAEYTLVAANDPADRLDVSPTMLANGYRYADPDEQDR